MHVSPKLLVTALLVVAIPAMVGTALTVQNLQQKAAEPQSPITISPTELNPNNCPTNGDIYQCSLQITNTTTFTIPWKVIGGGLPNITVTPQGGSLTASQSSTVAITIPVADCMTGKLARFQFIPGIPFAVATFTCSPVSGTPIPQPNVTRLSCDDCQASGQNTLCFNVNNRTAECRNGNGNNVPGTDFGTLCIRCPQVTPTTLPTPTGVCTPRPACLDAVPPCTIPEPFGGWCKPTPTPIACGGFTTNGNTRICPPGYVCDHTGTNPDFPGKCVPVSPTPTIPAGCKPAVCTIACPINNPNCCPVRYICPTGTPAISTAPTIPQGE